VRVTLTKVAAQQFESWPLTVKHRILTAFERLSRWPTASGVKLLRGPLAGSYRGRTGDWRVRFEVRADDVVVVQIGHRDRFYEQHR
jgi:mRNA-degrading endonuclease RelE of RelBE toxin-antitoxin system